MNKIERNHKYMQYFAEECPSGKIGQQTVALFSQHLAGQL